MKINFEKFELSNGLKVIVNEDNNTSMVAMNIVYDVGARDEDENQTGFAHLFEHLMFEGSVNIPNYDKPLQNAGGTNNAFTNNDITNYYITLPSQNIETGFWLESDRMMKLNITAEKLEIQKKVVIEEFKERYLNQPYGDIWPLIRKMCYETHPYKWPTIGKEISHIENAKLDDVEKFFERYYCPSNAILSISGNVKTAEILNLCKKWFEPISSGQKNIRQLPAEPEQTKEKITSVERKVPQSMLYMAWPMPGYNMPDYHAIDLFTEVLGSGDSSRLHQQLVKEKQIFSHISSYILGSRDPGLAIISGRLNKGIDQEVARMEIWNVINSFRDNPVSQSELTKTQNKGTTNDEIEMLGILPKAMKLGFAELIGNTNHINEEREIYNRVTCQDLNDIANRYFKPHKTNYLFYNSI